METKAVEYRTLGQDHCWTHKGGTAVRWRGIDDALVESIHRTQWCTPITQKDKAPKNKAYVYRSRAKERVYNKI